MRQITPLGRRIESDSFSIIDSEAGPHHHSAEAWTIVRRVIHATADFEFKELMELHELAIARGIDALQKGCHVVTDVRMILAGLNTQRLEHFGCTTHCFISDDDVIARARATNSTRAIESMRKAHAAGLLDGAIVAVGNAPTALLELLRLVAEERANPALVIGVPVGFVSAAESKDATAASDTPFIVARGRKGGSAIAVSILHALMMLAVERPS